MKRLEKNRKQRLAWAAKPKVRVTSIDFSSRNSARATTPKRKRKGNASDEGIFLLNVPILNYYLIYVLYSYQKDDNRCFALFGQ